MEDRKIFSLQKHLQILFFQHLVFLSVKTGCRIYVYYLKNKNKRNQHVLTPRWKQNVSRTLESRGWLSPNGPPPPASGDHHLSSCCSLWFYTDSCISNTVVFPFENRMARHLWKEKLVLPSLDAGSAGNNLHRPGVLVQPWLPSAFQEHLGGVKGKVMIKSWVRERSSQVRHLVGRGRGPEKAIQWNMVRAGRCSAFFLFSAISAHVGQPSNLKSGSKQNFSLGCSTYPLFTFSLLFFIWLSFSYAFWSIFLHFIS